MEAQDEEPSMPRTFDYEAARRREEAEREERRARRQAFLEKLLAGPDMHAWIVPREDVACDEILAEHLLQLRNTIRYALQVALDDAYTLKSSMNAANTVDRLVRTNIALVRALKTPDTAKSKTVRGGRRMKGPQD